MQLREMLQDDDAVSPVIGVILMVAITVILAAVIASFVLGLGPGEAAPTASFDFEHAQDSGTGDHYVTVTHANGDRLDTGNIKLAGDVQAIDTSTGDNATSGSYEWNAYSNSKDWGANPNTEVEDIGGGTSISAVLDGSGSWDVRVVWETADSSQTLDQATIEN